tara:strand:- start:689 stop:1075 length:387 start_codon:yes stop_codon:yes gene_type:complete
MIVDISAEQEWEQGYYYPVLPKLDMHGKFGSANNMFYPGGDYDYPNNNIPFPTDGPITIEGSIDTLRSQKFNIGADSPEPNVFNDESGNDNMGFTFNNYTPEFDLKSNEPRRKKRTQNIKISKKGRPF